MIENKIKKLLNEHDETRNLIRKVYSVVIFLNETDCKNLDELEDRIYEELKIQNKDHQRKFSVKTHTKDSLIIEVI